MTRAGPRGCALDWTAGYVSEVEYTHGYYRELAPGFTDFGLLLGGFAPPARSGMRYLELGYGQGLSANIHAAACPGEFWGTDFNPVHASNAQSLAAVSGANAHFSDDSFVDLLDRKDLPDFDQIALHGVWSWLSDSNRAAIVEILRRRLKVGGICYISYNTLPGWAMAMPLRHLMTLHAETAGSEAQGVFARINASIAFGQTLADAQARYFIDNPGAKGRLGSISGENRNYLAHEYFNRDWKPMYFSEVHDVLAQAKLGFACSASPIEQMDGFSLTPAQAGILADLHFGPLRESVRDYMVNQQFRKDLYTRGASRLSRLEQVERMDAQRMALLVNANDIVLEIQTALGPMSLQKNVYEPVLEALSSTNGTVRTIGEMGQDKAVAALPPGALVEVLAVLVGAGFVHPAQTEADIATAVPRTDALNAHLIERSRISANVTWLASPVIGGGVPVGQFEQMFLGARSRNAKTPSDWAGAVWQDLEKQNKAVVRNGVVLEGAEANIKDLTAQAKAFSDSRLPQLKRLGVAA